MAHTVWMHRAKGLDCGAEVMPVDILQTPNHLPVFLSGEDN